MPLLKVVTFREKKKKGKTKLNEMTYIFIMCCCFRLIIIIIRLYNRNDIASFQTILILYRVDDGRRIFYSVFCGRIIAMVLYFKSFCSISYILPSQLPDVSIPNVWTYWYKKMNHTWHSLATSVHWHLALRYCIVSTQWRFDFTSPALVNSGSIDLWKRRKTSLPSCYHYCRFSYR